MDKALLQHLVKLRRHLHKYPEIGFQEYNTRKVLEEEFKALGIAEENIHHAAETGMFVDIQGKAPASQEYQEDPSKLQPAPEAPNGQRIIAIRTDMDCLPLKETNEGLPYQSAIEKRAHMCGHDGHMANVCAVAHLVVRALDKIPSNCTVRLLCQPAEEGPGGAPPMIEDGCLEGVSEVYGWHNWTTMPFETVQVKSGPTMAHVAEFAVKIIGSGGHGSQPQSCVDPIVCASQIISSLQSIVSRNVHYKEPAVISVCQIQGGESRNAIPSECTFEGTMRDLNRDVYDLMASRMKTMIENIAEAYQCKAEITFEEMYPVLNNTDKEYGNVKEVVDSIVGPENVSSSELPMTGAEDFAYYTEKKPGCFFFIGTGEQGSTDKNAWHTSSGMHATTFDFNDRILNFSASIFIRILEHRLGISLYPDDPKQQRLLMPKREAYEAVAELGYELGELTPLKVPRVA